MSLKVPRDSSLTFLNALTAGPLGSAQLCLYKNNLTPIDTTILSDFTEATFDGYARITLTAWPAAALDANNKASVTLAFQTFTMTGVVTPNDIYGIFVLTLGGVLLYAERNPSAPITMNSVGQTYAYKPVFTDRSEF